MRPSRLAVIGVFVVASALDSLAQSIYTVAGGARLDGKPATSVGVPAAFLSLDSKGRVYIAADVENSVLVIDPADGIIRTAAGTGTRGYSGDGGPATEAQMGYGVYIGTDSLDNLYIDQGGFLRRVDHATGIITTMNPAGFGFADGPIADAMFGGIGGITSDAEGNLFVADRSNHRIRRVDRESLIVTTVAGNGEHGNSGDDGPATSARLGTPEGIVWHAGKLYFCEGDHDVVRVVDLATGTIRRFAGNGTSGFSGDGGPATLAQLAFGKAGTQPEVDAEGNVYVADHVNQRVRRIDAATGTITTMLGGGQTLPSVTDSPAGSLNIGGPSGLALDEMNRILYVSSGSRVLRVALDDGKTRFFAGGPSASSGDGGPALAARFVSPTALVWDGDGIMMADFPPARLRRVDLKAGLIDGFAGGGSQFDGTTFDDVALGIVPAMCRDASGRIYTVDPWQERILRFDPATRTVSVVAGNGTRAPSPDGVPASTASLQLPPTANTIGGYGIAVDSQGNIYFSEAGNYKVRKIDASSGLLSTVAGNGLRASNGDGGLATAASIFFPLGLALSPDERTLYVGEGTRGPEEGIGASVRRVDLTTGTITRYAGTGIPEPGPDDVLATVSGVVSPVVLAFDREGNLLIGDAPRIRRVDRTSNVITTIGGSFSGGALGDFGSAVEANISDFFSIAVDSATGDLAIADLGSNRIRVIPACRAAIDSSVLSAPANGATDVRTAPTLEWSRVDGAFSYDLYLDTGSATTIVAPDLRTTSYTPSNLVPGATYRWKVVSKGDPFCSALVTGESPAFAFTVAIGCPAPGNFALLTPANGATVTLSSATLTWSAAEGAGRYDLFFGTTNPPPYLRSTSGTSAPVTGLVANVTYYWQIVARSACNDSLTTASAAQFFRVSGSGVCVAPGAFNLLVPPSGATGLAVSTTLQWGSSANSTSYDVFFGTTSPPPIYLPDLTATNLAISGLAPGATYYWRARARTACDPALSVSTPERFFSVSGTCVAPGRPTITFAPPGDVGVGQTYVITWSPAFGLDANGLYQVERSTDVSFATFFESQLTEGTSASFVATQPGTLFHRVRAIPACDVTKPGPYSEVRSVTISAGSPNVVFTVQPPAVISNLGQAIEDKRASFTIENISNQQARVSMSIAPIKSQNFFTIYDPSGGDGVFITLEPRVPKTLDLRFSGPPNDTPGSYQGVIFIGVPGSTIIPYAFVNLKVGSEAGATPEILVGGLRSEYLFFPPFSSVLGDEQRGQVSIFVRNPGSTPMEVAAEIGPEVWLEPESGWNSQPIPAGASREVKLRTRRLQAPNGSALPRYTYLTIRTRTGESARILIQDNDVAGAGQQRPPLGDVSVRSYIVPDAVSDSTSGLVSKLRLTNTGSEPVQATLHFTPRDADGFDATKAKTVTIKVPGNDVATLTDPIAQIFGASGPGQIEVRASPEAIGQLTLGASIVRTRATEDSVADVPVVWRGEGAPRDTPFILAGVTSDATQRTELVVVETTGVEETSAVLKLFNAVGSLLGQATVTVPRYGQVAIADASATLAAGATLTAARVELTPVTGGGRLLLVGSIIDRTTGNRAVLVAQPKDGASSSARRALWAALQAGAVAENGASGLVRYVVPFVTSGKYGVSPSAATSLGLSSSLAGPVNVTLTYRPSTGASIIKVVNLLPGATQEFKDVLRELFALLGDQRGAMNIDAPAGVQVYSRSLAAAIGGGDSLGAGQNPVVPTGSTLLTGASANAKRILYLDGISQSVDATKGSRWSAVFAETAGQQAIVSVRLYEAGNRKFPIAIESFTVPAFGTLSLETLVQRMGLDSPSRRKDRTNMLCVIEPSSGAGMVTAVAVEQRADSGAIRSRSFVPVSGTPASGEAIAASLEAPPGTYCPSDALCLDGDHVTVQMTAKDPRTGATGSGLPIKQNELFGYFALPELTSNPDNPEVFVKFLDGRGFNGKYWVFYGGLTDFEYTMVVADRLGNDVKTYHKEPFGFCGGADTSAFAKQSLGSLPRARQAERSRRKPAAAGACTASEICLLGGKFGVSLEAKDPRSGATGPGLPIPQQDLFGYFAIPALTQNPGNAEMFVKMLDGRPVNGKYWAFYGGLTDFEVTITVRDTATGGVKTYLKEGRAFCGGADTNAF